MLVCFENTPHFLILGPLCLCIEAKCKKKNCATVFTLSVSAARNLLSTAPY